MTDLDKAIEAYRAAHKNGNSEEVYRTGRDLLAALDASRGQAVGPEWRTVPWRPTEGMLEIGAIYLDNPTNHDLSSAWSAMLAAAPKAPPAAPRVERYGDGVLVHWAEGVEQYVCVGDCVTGNLGAMAVPEGMALVPVDEYALLTPVREAVEQWRDCRSPMEAQRAMFKIEASIGPSAMLAARADEVVNDLQRDIQTLDERIAVLAGVGSNAHIAWKRLMLRLTQAQQPAAALPDGYALVPVEPTDAMLEAAEHDYNTIHTYGDWDEPYRIVWAAMLAAAREGE